MTICSRFQWFVSVLSHFQLFVLGIPNFEKISPCSNNYYTRHIIYYTWNIKYIIFGILYITHGILVCISHCLVEISQLKWESAIWELINKSFFWFVSVWFFINMTQNVIFEKCLKISNIYSNVCSKEFQQEQTI